jgi:hypothetical protein
MAHTARHLRLGAAGELAAAPLSFLLYRATRLLVQRLVQLDSRRHATRPARWQTLDGSAVARPFNLLALMTSAPRWNTHALIALAGPLPVRRTLRIHAGIAATSAPSWSLVVHAEPTHRIAASIGSANTPSQGSWRSVDLPPGRYRLALRYYRCGDHVVLPAIEVDGVPVVDPFTVPADTNDFYHDLYHGLGTGSRLLYLCLHSYACTMLRYRRWLPHSFVEREYLPAGNPQTTFRYGFWPFGTRLDIDLADGLLANHDVYLTAYNRASFPIMWYPLTDSGHTTAPNPVSGSYLIRVHRTTPDPSAGEREPVRVRVSRRAD